MTDASIAPLESADIPSHVDADRVFDFDYKHIPAVDGDVQRGWKAAVEGLPDIFFTPRHEGHWVATRNDLIEAVYRDTKTFSNAGLLIPPLPRDRVKAFQFGPAEFDPPEQGKYRRLISPFFNAERLGDLGAKAAALAETLIRDIAPRGECEFFQDFARRYPIGIFLSLVGLPQEDAATLLPYADLVVRGKTEADRLNGIGGMIGYLGDRIDERRAHPTDDLISRIANGEIDARPATRGEALGACANVMFAGLDTVVAASGFFIRFLATSPGHRRQLIADPGIIPAAVDELLRYHGLVNLGRLVTTDTELGGAALKAGDRLLLPTTLCGLDERRFPDPMTIDFARGDRKIMAFGTGPHLCLGAPLARIELRILLETWLAHIPDFEITDMAAIRTHSGGVNSIVHLPLRWNVG